MAKQCVRKRVGWPSSASDFDMDRPRAVATIVAAQFLPAHLAIGGIYVNFSEFRGRTRISTPAQELLVELRRARRLGQFARTEKAVAIGIEKSKERVDVRYPHGLRRPAVVLQVQANSEGAGIVKIKQILLVAGDGHDVRRFGGRGERHEDR